MVICWSCLEPIEGETVEWRSPITGDRDRENPATQPMHGACADRIVAAMQRPKEEAA